MGVIIYRIQCKVNNKVYIGQTTNYKERIKHHKYMLNKHIHTNKFLQTDFDKYGIDNFEFKILEQDVPDDLRLYKETYYMNKYGGTNSDNIYNVKGNFNDDNTEYALSKVKHCNGNFNLFAGHKHTEQTKQQISMSLKLAYKENRHKLPKSNFGENNSFYGKHHTEETKHKLSKLKTKYNDTYIHTLRALRTSGMKIKDIAKKYNINPRVAGLLIKYGTSSRAAIKQLCNSTKKCND